MPASRHPVPLFTVHNYNMRNDVYRDLKKIYNDKKLGAIIVRNDVYNDDIEFFEFFKGILSNYRVIYRNDIMTLYVKK